jgi:hypothetical protein
MSPSSSTMRKPCSSAVLPHQREPLNLLIPTHFAITKERHALRLPAETDSVFSVWFLAVEERRQHQNTASFFYISDRSTRARIPLHDGR